MAPNGSVRLKYPFARPVIPTPERWVPILAASYEERWFANGGPVARELEAKLRLHVGGGRDAALVSSATSGITAALIALGVEGRVAVPAFTFPATIHAIELAGCVPVLCDIDSDTWELAVDAAEDALTQRGCSAIVHVRAFGLCRDLSPIEQLARQHGAPLIIDSAAAFGGRTPDRLPVGRSGDAEVFSFHATKVFAVGEGGVVLARPDVIARVRHASNFAMSGANVTGRGLNAKLSETSAAIGLVMLDDLESHVAYRSVAADLLADIAHQLGAGLPEATDIGEPAWQCLPLMVPHGVSRDRVLSTLAEYGIEGRAYYCPGLHRTTAWGHTCDVPLPRTDAVAARALCLPLYSDLNGSELEHFARATLASFARAGSALAVTSKPAPTERAA